MPVSDYLSKPGIAATCAAVLVASIVSVKSEAAQNGNTAVDSNPTIITLTGLRITDTTPGTGSSPTVGQTCQINYTTSFYLNGAKGDKIQSSVDQGQPLTFVLGKGQVRREWDEGILTMKVGGKRTIVAPAQSGLAPPPESWTPAQPPGLVFEIELLNCA